MSSWPYTSGRAQPRSCASDSNRAVPKTWSMWWWENTATAIGSSGRQRLTPSNTTLASKGPPVSRNTSPSPLSIAVTEATLFR